MRLTRHHSLFSDRLMLQLPDTGHPSHNPERQCPFLFFIMRKSRAAARSPTAPIRISVILPPSYEDSPLIDKKGGQPGDNKGEKKNIKEHLPSKLVFYCSQNSHTGNKKKDKDHIGEG